MPEHFVIPPAVPTRVVRIGHGVLGEIPSVLSQVQVSPPATCVIVADRRTFAAAGERVQTVVAGAGFDVRLYVLQDDTPGRVSGEAHQVREVVDACGGHRGVLLGVGSGVVNDLGKLAARRTGMPYVAVPTAASMNGYGSPVAAIVQHGVKKTLPAAPTVAIVADLDVIARAPRDLARSGFADLLSKATATADWTLAHLVRDEPYDPGPHELLDPVVQRCMGLAAAIGDSDPGAIAVLMEGLIFGGFSMTLAGHSAPASGSEHLMSHLWDMQSQVSGGPHALHGFQVAIGTRVVAALYERLLRLDARDIDVQRLRGTWRPWDQVRRDLKEAHGPLFGAVEPEAGKQHLQRDEFERELAVIRDRWEQIKQRVSPLLLSPRRLLELHRQAGVPTDPVCIGQSRASVRHALLHARDVRARFTVLDLATELGLLRPWADSLLDDAGLESRAT